jgi:hypothetical protein
MMYALLSPPWDCSAKPCNERCTVSPISPPFRPNRALTLFLHQKCIFLSPPQQIGMVWEIYTMIAAHVKMRTVWLRQMLYLVLVITLYGWFFVIARCQWNGKYMCYAVLVQFGDVYDPELAYLSGPFGWDGEQNNRPKYVDQSKTLQLRYSRSKKAWVFEPIDPDRNHIIIKSSETDSFDVLSVAGLPWSQNTSAGFVTVDWLTLRNNECNEERCPTDRGACDDTQTCVCHEDFVGENCQFDAPKCQWYGLDLRTRSSLANIGKRVFCAP